MSTTVILDYGIGNLHSLAKAIARHGGRVRIASDAASATAADALVLPGVGAFPAAAASLAPYRDRLRGALLAGLPCLGICLGMQLLFEESDEGAGRGLGVLPGRVRRLTAARIPHMGWNVVSAGGDDLFRGLERLDAYYANSYAASPDSPGNVIAWTEYDGDRFPAAVRRGQTWGVQFHPEKSAEAGLRLIANFLDAVRP